MVQVDPHALCRKGARHPRDKEHKQLPMKLQILQVKLDRISEYMTAMHGNYTGYNPDSIQTITFYSEVIKKEEY